MKKLLLFILFPTILFSQIQIGENILGESSEDYSGYSISLSSDGTILAIGAPYNNALYNNNSNSGHVRIYKNNNGVWEQIGSDIDGESPADYSGNSVSVSSNGNIIAIGASSATHHDSNRNISGHVRIYENNSGIWEQIGSDINGESSGDNSGYSVSLSSDGKVVAIGAPDNSDLFNNSGHVRIYENNSGIWEQIGSDINGESSGDNSGYSVSLSSDGKVVAIGAPKNNSQSQSGRVRIYKNNNEVWEQIGSDIDGELPGDLSGTSVSLSYNGNIIAIGTPKNNSQSQSGRVRIYKNNNEVWEQIGSDIDGELPGDLSGTSVSLSSNGNIIAIGAPNNKGSFGQVRIYENNNGVWQQSGNDIESETAGNFLGSSVSLSPNGKIVAIGSLVSDLNGIDSGHVEVYDLSTVLTTDNNLISDFKIYPNPASEEVILYLNDLNLKEVSIFNKLGQLVKVSKTKTINTSILKSGIYFLQIETDLGIGIKKLVIE